MKQRGRWKALGTYMYILVVRKTPTSGPRKASNLSTVGGCVPEDERLFYVTPDVPYASSRCQRLDRWMERRILETPSRSRFRIKSCDWSGCFVIEITSIECLLRAPSLFLEIYDFQIFKRKSSRTTVTF